MSTMTLPVTADTPPDLIFVARQPILDEARRVFGYELLYRGSQTDSACVMDSDVASARVLTDALLSIGFDTLTFTPLFVAARVTGWTAHIMEQQANNRLIRPLSKYTGPGERHVPPLAQRG